MPATLRHRRCAASANARAQPTAWRKVAGTRQIHRRDALDTCIVYVRHGVGRCTDACESGGVRASSGASGSRALGRRWRIGSIVVGHVAKVLSFELSGLALVDLRRQRMPDSAQAHRSLLFGHRLPLLSEQRYPLALPRRVAGRLSVLEEEDVGRVWSSRFAGRP